MSDALGKGYLRLLERIDVRLDAEPKPADLLRDNLDKLTSLPLLWNGLLATKVIVDLLNEVGTTVADFKRALVRAGGVSIDDDTLPDPGDEDVDIVFHDDDFTTMELVVAALTECFAIPQAAAMKAMVHVHKTGASVVTTCSASEARQRIAQARARALEAGMPLRISWRPAKPSE